MGDDSGIIKGGALTSDLPTTPPAYPGKPISHRFVPTEQPRMHTETAGLAGPKFAGIKPFNPVASVSYPDRTVYLGPVSNIAPRRMASSVPATTQPVPQGTAAPQIPEEIRRQVEEQVRLAVEKYQTEHHLTTGSTPPPTTTPTASPTREAQTVVPKNVSALPQAQPSEVQPLADLQKLKDEARLVLAKRDLPENKADSPITQPAKPTVDTTQQVLAEASKIQAEIADLQKQVVQKQSTPDPHEKKEKEYLAQISQLITSRADLQTKVNTLNTQISQEVEKRSNVEGQLANVESKLKEAEERASESERKLGTVRTELSNTVMKVKEFEETVKALQEKQQFLIQTQKEAPKAPDQAEKPASPAPAIHGEKAFPNTLPALAPIAPGKEGPVKVVKPQVAIGKMAPSLTNAANVINGIVKDPKGLLLANIVIVVKDDTNEPVRALKSNKIGQFAISTPLPNGTYTMELESSEHTFDVVQLELDGKVLPPIELKANN